jgi:hypothetical protein
MLRRLPPVRIATKSALTVNTAFAILSSGLRRGELQPAGRRTPWTGSSCRRGRSILVESARGKGSVNRSKDFDADFWCANSVPTRRYWVALGNSGANSPHRLTAVRTTRNKTPPHWAVPSRNRPKLNGVQGVAGSNPAVPMVRRELRSSRFESQGVGHAAPGFPFVRTG